MQSCEGPQKRPEGIRLGAHVRAFATDNINYYPKCKQTGGQSRQFNRQWTEKDSARSPVYHWFLGARALNLPISGPILAKKAKHLAFLLDDIDFQPGGCWTQRFKERHGIVYKAIVGEAGSLDVDTSGKWVEGTLPHIFETYADRDVYNGDETDLFLQMLPSKTHAGDPCKGGKHSKVRVTVFLCANMDGSDKCPAFVVGKSRNPRCFRGAARIPVRYRNNGRAWMTRELFTNGS